LKDITMYGSSIYGMKVIRPERFYKKPIFDRVIDLRTFYTLLMGVEPKELYIGQDEWRELMIEQRDVGIVERSSAYRIVHPRAMLGQLCGMAVFKKDAKHHLECV